MAKFLEIETEDGALVARMTVTLDRGVVLAFGRSFGHQYVGRVEERRFSKPLEWALDEYREVNDDQILSLVDEAQRRVLEFRLVAMVQPEGVRRRLRDFQLYSDGTALVALDE